jgi:hypothetical protein
MNLVIRKASMSNALPAAGTLRVGGDVLAWPRTEIIRPGWYRLLEDYVVEWQAEGFARQRLTVPAGFECDGASVPALLEWYLGRERILPAGVAHDFQYRYQGRTPLGSHQALQDGVWTDQRFAWSRQESDRFFARNLQFCKIKDHQRRNAYRAVRLAGRRPWGKGQPAW